MTALLASQATLIDSLAAQRAAAPPNPLASLASGGPTGAIAAAPGARGVAVLEYYRRQSAANPTQVTEVIRDNATRAMDVPGTLNSSTMVSFVTHWMPWGRAPKGVIMLSFAIAHAADRMARREWEAAEALLYQTLCSVKQAQYDAQRWSMSWLTTQLAEPPWHLMMMEPPNDGIWPYGRLTPPEWIAAQMQYVTDAARLAEVRGRRGGGGGHGGQQQQQQQEEGEESGFGRGRGRRAKPKPKAA